METDTTVIVRFTRNDVFEFQNGSMQITCIVRHIPQGEGDHFHFEYNGIKFSVNPLCSDFVGVVSA